MIRRLILSAMCVMVGTCLSGCVGRGSRTVTIVGPFGTITITDTVHDVNGKPSDDEFIRGFDPNFWKFLAGFLLPDKPDREQPEDSDGTDGG